MNREAEQVAIEVLNTYPAEYLTPDVKDSNYAELITVASTQGAAAAWQLAHQVLTRDYPKWVVQFPDRWQRLEAIEHNKQVVESQLAMFREVLQMQHQWHQDEMAAIYDDRDTERRAWLQAVRESNETAQMAIAAMARQAQQPVYINNHVESHGGAGGQGGSARNEGGSGGGFVLDGPASTWLAVLAATFIAAIAIDYRRPVFVQPAPVQQQSIQQF